MNIVEALLKEFDQEAQITRKMLSLVPTDQFDWGPHDRSMKLKALAVHVAEIAAWPEMMIESPELDFAKMDYTPTEVNNTANLVEVFEKGYKQGRAALEKSTETILQEQWLLRNGETIYLTMNKYEAIRHALAQTVHHRAQLGVYLRLQNIAIPGSYGPSADDSAGF